MFLLGKRSRKGALSNMITTTHDPLCPRDSHSLFCEGCTPECGTCQCSLIANARANERMVALEEAEKAITRLMQGCYADCCGGPPDSDFYYAEARKAVYSLRRQE